MNEINKISDAFRIKMLSGGKVILVESSGYESELFVPLIINNRITLQNAIEDRRCCKRKLNSSSKILQSKTENVECLSKKSFEHARPVPLANSTPAKIRRSIKENLNPTQRFPTPDIVRRAVVQNRNASMQGLPPGIKVVPLHRAPTPNTPNKVAKIISSSKRQKTPAKPQALRNLKNVSIFRTPPSLSISNNTSNTSKNVLNPPNTNVSIPVLPPGIKVVRLHRAPTPNTPNRLVRIHPSSRIQSPRQPQILRNLSNVSLFKTPARPSIANNSIAACSPNQSFLLRRIYTPGSVTKWRKCITPQRTYIRRSSGQNKKTPLKVKHVKPMPLSKNGRALLDFQLNPTKYPPGEGSVLVKRRKLIIDNKVIINPKEFKQQLKDTDDLKRVTSFELPKNRTQYIASHQTAFDLLTNSYHYPRMSNKLNKLFRKGCVYKRADTILKYRQLIAGIPQLETL